MALVGYSDSEDSDADAEVQKPAPKPAEAAKKPLEKLISSNGPRRIKVDLPAAPAPDASASVGRPAKRAKTGGAFSDFNALLPAPKRNPADNKKNGLGSGVSLKTSSAAAFSREPIEQPMTAPKEEPTNPSGSEDHETTAADTGLPPVEAPERAEEVKIVGNAMRFRPLSVANNKKKPKKPLATTVAASQSSTASAAPASKKEAPPPKPAVSLFSMHQEARPASQQQASDDYRPMLSTEEAEEEDLHAQDMAAPSAAATANPLTNVADDLGLSDADRRRLFGRGARDGPVNITNFNMDQEYRRNEALRASGEATQHRAVRTVGSGKHSVQQLVNSAVGQKEALEDKWAEGRRNRGDAGNKYGW